MLENPNAEQTSDLSFPEAGSSQDAELKSLIPLTSCASFYIASQQLDVALFLAGVLCFMLLLDWGSEKFYKVSRLILSASGITSRSQQQIAWEDCLAIEARTDLAIRLTYFDDKSSSVKHDCFRILTIEPTVILVAVSVFHLLANPKDQEAQSHWRRIYKVAMTRVAEHQERQEKIANQSYWNSLLERVLKSRIGAVLVGIFIPLLLLIGTIAVLFQRTWYCWAISILVSVGINQLILPNPWLLHVPIPSIVFASLLLLVSVLQRRPRKEFKLSSFIGVDGSLIMATIAVPLFTSLLTLQPLNWQLNQVLAYLLIFWLMLPGIVALILTPKQPEPTEEEMCRAIEDLIAQQRPQLVQRFPWLLTVHNLLRERNSPIDCKPVN